MEQHIKEQHLADILAEIQEAKDKKKHFLSLDGELSQLNDDQEITKIFTKIGELEYLEKLDLRNNEIKIIPESITNLVNLTHLHLASNKLTQIPESITNLVNLTHLHLDSNKLTKIPESITNLVNLKTLDFRNNEIKIIPESITNLVSLTWLSFHNNKLTKIPESITNLVNLTHLYLASNQLTQIPESITNLVNLKTLDLDSNKLTQIPESITNLVNLTHLYLASNQLTQIPESITNLVNLTHLSLAFNQLTQIPESITNLVNLTHLYLASNQLTQIPESITNLVNLTKLVLAFNQLTQIPESITNLVNLTHLYLSKDQLTQIPESITNLTNVTELKINGNNILTISQQNIVKKEQEVTQEILEKTKEKNPNEISNLEPLNNCRLKDYPMLWQKILDNIKSTTIKSLFAIYGKLIDLDVENKTAIIYLEFESLSLKLGQYQSKLEKAFFESLGTDFKIVFTSNHSPPYKKYSYELLDDNLDLDSSDSASKKVEDFQEIKLKNSPKINFLDNTTNLEPLNNCQSKKNAITWERLKFRSNPELEIAKELDKRGICFAPNSGMRITTAKGRKTKEPDFLIFYNKKYAILEVDGPFHTPKTRREEQEIEADFENHGIRIFRFDADECSKNPSAVVDKFLERLNNI
ncbi:MAG: leucine-rich repeat domain-containing protein [Microcoleaceae cyanobacterium MO_207.B10]|nr:leucine-rich repeat domain-containing protein [Microcoleaceae cyanobacterium MO_207.B10]